MKSQAGYTLLLEVLLGLTLVVVALFVVAQLFVSSDGLVAHGDRRAQAHRLALELQESVLARDYDDVSSYAGVETLSHAVRRGTEINTEFAYRVDVTVPSSGDDVKLVRVIVLWGREPVHSVLLDSAKGRNW